MKNTKLILVALLIILVAVVILQNTEPVMTKLIFFTITLPRAVLLLLMALIGFIIGVLTVFRYTRKQGLQENKTPKQTPV